jgi:hypothetical protein
VLADGLACALDELCGVAEQSSDATGMSPFNAQEAASWLRLRESKAFDPTFGNPMGLLVGSAGLQGRRQSMEDHAVVLDDLNATLGLPFSMPDHAFFGVYDGHDGDGVSLALSERLHQYVCACPQLEADPVAALVAGFLVRTCLRCTRRCSRVAVVLGTSARVSFRRGR